MSEAPFAYSVTWSQEDGEYLGTCVEFPSLSWLAPTSEKALTGIQRLVAEVTLDILTSNET